MYIEKEYELTIDDYINYQRYFLRKYSNKYSAIHLIQWLIFYLPIIFILFSLNFIEDNTVKYMAIIISISIFLYYLFINIFSEKINNNYLKKDYYKYFISENVRILITEHSILNYNNNSEQKYLPNWIYKCESDKNYIFLMDNKNHSLILPKKHFSNEEQENIIKHYGINIKKT